jgi:hypothetical protein
VYGLVTDPSGSPVPDAKVTAIQSASGLERETTTDREGRYQLAALMPGEYEVRVQAGSVGAIVRDVPLRVGAAIQVNVNLALQSAVDTVEASASILSVADADLTQVIPYEAIRDLPINGRRFQEFAALTPTVLAGPETQGHVSFLGQRPVHTNILIDGTDFNEPFLGGLRGGDRAGASFVTPQLAVAEFQTVTSGYSAEYGRSTGGVLNAITRSGTNSYHGDAFYQLRDGALSSTTPLGQDVLERQHQFGGAAGGPAIRNRLFFFGAAEQQFAQLPRTVGFNQLNSIPRTADVAEALEFFRSQERGFEQTNDATAALGRGDYRFGDSHVLTGRYQYSRNNAVNGAAPGVTFEPLTNRALSSNGTEWDTSRTIGGQLTSAFSPGFLNDLRVQHSFEHRRRIPVELSPFLQAGSVGTAGTPPLLPYRLRDRRLQIADGVTVLKGAHAFKFGVDYSFIGFYQWFGDNQTGAFVISNPDAGEVLRILSRSGGAAGNRFDDPSVVYRRQVGVLGIKDSAHQVAFFLQDTWRTRRNLTVNAGVRWEGQLNPSPDISNQGLTASVRDFTFPLGRVNPERIGNNLQQWAPRFGIAWNPGARRTTIRAQAGLFYAQTPLSMLIGPLSSFSTSPTDLTVEVAPGARGTVYDQFAAAGIDLNRTPLANLPRVTPQQVRAIAGGAGAFSGTGVVTTSGDFRNPRAGQLSLGVQHEIVRGLVVDYQFNYVNTNNLLRNVDYNVPQPGVRSADASLRPFFGLRSGGVRPNTAVGQVLVRDSGAKARYSGHSFRLQFRGPRTEFAANYTLAFNKSDDDNERALSGITYGNPFDFTREYNWSDLDIRHMASGYVLFRAPLGFTITSLFRVRSGFPIDPTTGEDSAELLNGSIGNRPMERPGLPFLRNSFRNRGFKTVDVRLLKTLFQMESVRVQFSAEVFNIFNFDNVAFLGPVVLAENPAFRYGLGILPNGQMAPVAPGFLRLRDAGGAYLPGVAGQAGTPFQAQLGVRLLF